MKKFVALVGAVTLLAAGSTGCMGRMALAGKVGQFNMEVVDGKWPHWIVFLCLYIIPVYPFAGAIDLLIINSIEFHTGTNPISGQDRLARAGERHEEVGPNGEAVVSTRRADGSIDLVIRDVYGNEHFVNVIAGDGEYTARDRDGRSLARVDASGRVDSL